MKKLAILKILAILMLIALMTIPIIKLLTMHQIDTVECSANAVRTIPVGAYWYLWYGYNFTSHSWTGGDGTYHWNHDSDVVVDRPIIGYYTSLNNETIKWQIDHMKASGLSFAIVSWWGWGVRNFSDPNVIEEGYQAINNATINLFNYLKDSGTTFKIAIMVEPFNIGEMDYTQVYNYVWNVFYSKYDPWVFKWEGKPLLAWFNPLSPPSNSSFTNRIVGNPPNNVDWVFWKGMDALDSYSGNAEPQEWLDLGLSLYNPVLIAVGVITAMGIVTYGIKRLID